MFVIFLKILILFLRKVLFCSGGFFEDCSVDIMWNYKKTDKQLLSYGIGLPRILYFAHNQMKRTHNTIVLLYFAYKQQRQ